MFERGSPRVSRANPAPASSGRSPPRQSRSAAARPAGGMRCHSQLVPLPCPRPACAPPALPLLLGAAVASQLPALRACAAAPPAPHAVCSVRCPGGRAVPSCVCPWLLRASSLCPLGLLGGALEAGAVRTPALPECSAFGACRMAPCTTSAAWRRVVHRRAACTVPLALAGVARPGQRPQLLHAVPRLPPVPARPTFPEPRSPCRAARNGARQCPVMRVRAPLHSLGARLWGHAWGDPALPPIPGQSVTRETPLADRNGQVRGGQCWRVPV